MTLHRWPQRPIDTLQRFALPAAIILIAALLWLANNRPFQTPVEGLPDLGRSTLSFTPNAGQTDSQVRYLAHTPGNSFFFTEDGLTFSGGESVVRWQFVGMETAEIEAANPLPGVANYLYGQDAGSWRTNLPTYQTIQYKQLYSGVDVDFTGHSSRLAATFTLEAGAAPETIQWQFVGTAPQVTDGGGLELVDENGRTLLTIDKPVAHQGTAEEAVQMDGRFSITPDGLVSVNVENLNAAVPASITLAVNPMGGNIESGLDYAYDVAINDADEIFVVGYTSSRLFPVVQPFQDGTGGLWDVFIAKYSPTGQVLFSTYLGGSDDDLGYGIEVDSAGNAIVTGATDSADFPTMNPIMTDMSGSEAFISKLSADGSQLLFSTYLGGAGNEYANAVAVNAQNELLVAGWTASADFPLLNPVQAAFGGGIADAFLSKISGNNYQLLYSTYLGGSDIDFGYDVASDQSGNIFLVGSTISTDFPVQNTGVPQPQGPFTGQNAFVTKLSPGGGSLLFSSMLGGSGDDLAFAAAADLPGNVYVVGQTRSADFPLASPHQANLNGNIDAFITRVSGDGSGLLFSSYMGGEHAEFGTGVVVGGAGNVFLTGITWSSDFPILNPIVGMGYPGEKDAFVVMQNPADNLVWSTYLGGTFFDDANSIDVDTVGRPVVVGSTHSADFPMVNAAQGVLRYNPDAFVSRINHAGTLLEFSTYLGGDNGYPGDPTDVSVSEVGGTAEFNPIIYLAVFALLVVLITAVWFTNSRRPSA